jgi:hypothetical protein
VYSVDGDVIRRLPSDDRYWRQTHIRRTFLEDTVPVNGKIVIFMVCKDDIDRYTREYLSERRLGAPIVTCPRGRPPVERDRVVKAMVERYCHQRNLLENGKLEALASEFGTSPKTIRNARPLALFRIVPKSL